jgi:type IV secretion system protein VirB10
MRLVLTILLAATAAAAQTDTPAAPAPATAAAESSSRQVTIPAGTKVLLQLKSPIDTKHARPGDGVYCQTSFPVTLDNLVVIPAGTYVKGEIAEVRRAGRVKGRAEVLFHFNTMIFPGGYTVDLPGALEDEPGAVNHSVTDKEGTVKADSQKGKDAGTIAKGGATGSIVGAVVGRSFKDAGIGGGIGAAVGLAQVLLTRGQDVRIEQGASLEMVLQRSLTVEISRVESDNAVVPRPADSRKLHVPGRTPR